MSADMIAGYHDVYWAANGVSTTVICGITGPSGIRLIRTPNVEIITGDELGPDTPIDILYKGGSCVLEFVVQEVKLAAVKSLIAPFQHLSSTPRPEYVGVPGQLGSISHLGTLELIPRTGTPAASLNASGGNGRRFKGMHIGPVEESLDVNQRVIAIRFQCFPWVDAGDSSLVKWWKWIASANA